MSARCMPLRFTRGTHQYSIIGAIERGEYIGMRDGTVIARGRDRYSVARALIVAGTPIKRGAEDAGA